jgi:beta-glucosidase
MNRRDVIRGAAAVGGSLLAGGGLLGAGCTRNTGQDAAPAETPAKALQYRFPGNFLWGAGTSGLQHEGSPLADGAGPSTMYQWAHAAQGKKVEQPDWFTPPIHTFDVSADFYRRHRSDIQLMRDMNLRAYNFEVYWPRILPEGTGKVNGQGLDFYDRLVDEFLAADIVPLCNLYVFDHPAALQDRGGWLNRDMAQWFADYASILFNRLGDRIPYWTTICEIQIINHISYAAGMFPPEMQDVSASLRANHHLLLGQGLAVQALRASSAKGEIGNQHSVMPVSPASESEADVAAARRANAYFNLLATDPQLRGEYPDVLIEWYGKGWPHDAILDGDLNTISEPIDFFGVDFYGAMTVRHDPSDVRTRYYAGLQTDITRLRPTGEDLHEALLWVHERYRAIPVHLLEIGIDLDDTAAAGRVDDPERISYIRDLLIGAHRAMDSGVDLRSCFVWSFLDGWEFNDGLSSRYGLVYVDYETQERIVKSSGYWYRDIIAANALSPTGTT